MLLNSGYLYNSLSLLWLFQPDIITVAVTVTLNVTVTVTQPLLGYLSPTPRRGPQVGPTHRHSELQVQFPEQRESVWTHPAKRGFKQSYGKGNEPFNSRLSKSSFCIFRH